MKQGRVYWARIPCVSLVCFSLCIWGTVAFAENLMDVYRHAFVQDPEFKAAAQRWYAQQQDLSIARAGLLPSVHVASSITRQHDRSTLSPSLATLVGQDVVKSYSTPYTYSAAISQPIFDIHALANLAAVKSRVKAERAQWDLAKQSLLLRVATRYFAVLQSIENLRFVQAEEKALSQQLEQAHQRYKVGLSAVTPYYEARARHDAVVAQRIGARYALANRLEQLRALTGHYYTKLQAVSRDFSPNQPRPANIQAWVDVALANNLALQSARYTVMASQRNLDAQRAVRYPTLHAEAGYRVQRGADTSVLGVGDVRNGYAQLNLSFPVVQGGRVGGQTRKAYFSYRERQAQLTQKQRETISQTRQAYWDIISTIQEIQAGSRAVHSAQSALDANQAGYRVGTRTMVDVLLSQSQLYQAKNTLIQEVYAYLLQKLQLQFVSGRLTEKDLMKINQYLTQVERVHTHLDTGDTPPMKK